MRGGSNMADIQVNLLRRDERSLQSHDLAKKVRPHIQEIALRNNANVKVVEVPPGPPVLSTIVAEVYGPDYKEQIRVAHQLKEILANTEDVVDIDWSVEDVQIEYRLEVDNEKAMLNGIAPQQVVGNLTYLLGEYPVSYLFDENSVSPVGIVMGLDDRDKTGMDDIRNLKITAMNGDMLPVCAIDSIKQDTVDN